MELPKNHPGLAKGEMTPVPSFVEVDGVCLHYTAEKGKNWPEHCHDKHQIIIVAEPKSECEIAWKDNQNEKKQVGLFGQNIIYIEKSVAHAFRTGAAGVFISVGVSAKEAMRLTLGNLWSGVRITPWWKVLKHDIFIWNVVQVIRSLCYSEQRPHHRDLASYAQSLTSHLLAVERGRRASVFEGLTPIQLRKVDIFIEEHFRDSLSLKDIAAVIGLKKDHFAHLFKMSTGISPHRYIISLRLEYVRRLKMLGRFTNAQIAAEAGFYDESHLIYTIKNFSAGDLENYRAILRPATDSSNEENQ